MIEESATTGKYPRPIRSEAVLAYMTYLVKKPEEYQLRVGERVLPGRGLQYPTVKQALWAIADQHKAMGLADPTKTHYITSWLGELSRKHVAHGAPAYDVVEARHDARALLGCAALRARRCVGCCSACVRACVRACMLAYTRSRRLPRRFRRG